MGVDAIGRELADNAKILEGRAKSTRIRTQDVRGRIAALSEVDFRRASRYAERSFRQRSRLGLPPLPTTTIGSFPQTPEIRRARAQFRLGDLSAPAYRRAMQNEISDAIRRQEAIGLDLLVHGEAERNDMVEHFAEPLKGFVVTRHAWVQSFGSRCVKPPILFGDVVRPAPMTVEWSAYAQRQTRKPVKGMLTGPVTMLQWSFVRDDQPRR